MRRIAFFVQLHLKASEDYASKRMRDPGRGGYIIIKAMPRCGSYLFLLHFTLKQARIKHLKGCVIPKTRILDQL